MPHHMQVHDFSVIRSASVRRRLHFGSASFRVPSRLGLRPWSSAQAPRPMIPPSLAANLIVTPVGTVKVAPQDKLITGDMRVEFGNNCNLMLPPELPANTAARSSGRASFLGLFLRDITWSCSGGKEDYTVELVKEAGHPPFVQNL